MSKTPHILMVDDLPLNLIALERILRDFDAELIKANSGKEALEKMLEYDFSLILMDVHMPVMDGIETAMLIREDEDFQHIPLIFITANTDSSAEFQGYESGAVDFLMKPINDQFLKCKVRIFLELAKKHQLEVEYKVQQKELAERKKFERQLKEYNVKLDFLNNELIRSNEELDQFTSLIAHDLKNPLHAICTFSDLVSDIVKDSESKEIQEVKGMVDRISSISWRASRMITDLLELASLSASPVQFVEVPVEDVVKDIIEDSFKILKSKNAKIETGLLPVLEGDKTQIHHILQNLISNGLKYCKEDVAPVVRVYGEMKDEDRVIIHVEDNGIGFDEKHTEDMFNLFKRLDPNNKRYEGSGVGLAVVKRLIQKHGGDIRVRSVIGKGSTFSVEFPMVQGMETLVEPLNDLTKVLVVAEDIAHGESIKNLLKHQFDVVIELDPLSAIKRVSEEKVDVLFTDLILEPINGLELVQEVKRADLNVICMMSMNVKDEDFIANAKSNGVVELFEKPVCNESLTEAIEIQCISRTEKMNFTENIRNKNLSRFSSCSVE